MISHLLPPSLLPLPLGLQLAAAARLPGKVLLQVVGAGDGLARAEAVSQLSLAAATAGLNLLVTLNRQTSGLSVGSVSAI